MTLLPGYFSAGPFIALVLFIKDPLDPRQWNGGGGGGGRSAHSYRDV